MSDEDFGTVRSDLNFIQSGIGEINSKAGELSMQHLHMCIFYKIQLFYKLIWQIWLALLI